MVPPSRAREREARAAGVRAQSSLLGLAGAAWALAGLLELGSRTWPSDPRFTLEPTTTLDLGRLALGSGATLLVLLALLLVATVAIAKRGEARRRLAVEPDAASLGGLARVALSLSAIAAIMLVEPGLLAGAARSVDAPGEALARAWSGWARHGLLGIALVATAVGVAERWLSARRLWRALHLTPAQAREQARASASRARRGLR